MGALFNFGGRVGRSAYWGVIAATVALYAGYIVWAANLAPWERIQVYTSYSYYSGDSSTQISWGSDDAKPIYICFAIAAAVLLLISLSVSARRWHDLGKSAWWSLISIVPIVGSLYVFVMLGFVAGSEGPNRYDDARRPGGIPVPSHAGEEPSPTPWWWKEES
ncbi:MAG TPA: DUF805 domain-containing protein [Thermomicrobiales bacterium]|nr:DUF805 domain-containing protein [Thermomicrobiales bacterium]